MPQDRERVGVLHVPRRQKPDLLAVGEWKTKITRRTVHADEHGLLGELGPIARAASSPEAPSGNSSSEESGSTTFIAREDTSRALCAAVSRNITASLYRDPGSGFSLSPPHAHPYLARRRRRSARPACDSACAPGDRRQLGKPAGALLAGARRRRGGDGFGWAVSTAARRRRDARLFLISLAFIASSGFLGLHALATPTVLLGPNAGFELATPFGLVVAGLRGCVVHRAQPERARSVVRSAPLLLAGLCGLMGIWAVVSLAELPPLDGPLEAEELDGSQLVLAAGGLALYGFAAFGFIRLYRRRPARFVFAFTLAFAFLAEAMVVIAWAANWQLSWWEWHVLMLGAFLVIAQAARSEWHEERFTRSTSTRHSRERSTSASSSRISRASLGTPKRISRPRSRAC